MLQEVKTTLQELRYRTYITLLLQHLLSNYLLQMLHFY